MNRPEPGFAELMRRVFAVDVLECAHCHHGPMRILAVIHPPQATHAILEHLGLPTRLPPLAAPVIAAEDHVTGPNVPELVS